MSQITNSCADFLNHHVVTEFEPNLGTKVSLTVIFGVILLVGIIGNSITIKVTQVLQTNGYLQKNVTDHMVSLACSDLLVLLLGMPVELYSAIWYPFTSASGNASCKIYNFLFEACSFATILNVATLSFERYIAICHPFKYKSLSGSRTVKLIVFVWATSVCVALPLLFATGTEDPLEQLEGRDHPCKMQKSNRTICTNLASRWTLYRASIYSAFVVYIVVLVSVALMCREMMKILMGRNKSGTLAVRNGENEIGGLPKHESSKSKASRKQTIIFLGLIVGALAGCWMPNQVRRIMNAAKPKNEWNMAYFRAYITLTPIADTFFYLSSVLNPFLYNLSSRQFREVFLQVLQCHLTIQHVNKRTVIRSDINSARSTRPLMLASIRRGLPSNSKAKTGKFAAIQKPAPNSSTDSTGLATDTSQQCTSDQITAVAQDTITDKSTFDESEM
uniref:G protein-coupled receptor 39 n=1 Tax=Lepisosteus oculatus TaxID=7918 RepID=W5M500_LEPOC|nr:PREDICTED: G-protein coupled receptor 39 [Lepisosteus oculatus]